MTRFAAFLRGVNVGGNNLIAKNDLAAIGERAGLSGVRTYLTSGNILFSSTRPEEELAAALETELAKTTGTDIRVVIRSTTELAEIVAGNPFPDAVPSQVGVLLVSGPVRKEIANEFVTPGKETVVAGRREIYIHYPDSMGRSKLKMPAPVRTGTMRNIGMLTKLAGLAN